MRDSIIMVLKLDSKKNLIIINLPRNPKKGGKPANEKIFIEKVILKVVSDFIIRIILIL
jgi:hypothetical protein